jgi:hypothetical protein
MCSPSSSSGSSAQRSSVGSGNNVNPGRTSVGCAYTMREQEGCSSAVAPSHGVRPAGGGCPADHPGCRRLPDPDPPASATGEGRVLDPLPVSGLWPAEAASLLAQPGHWASGRLSRATLPGVCGPAMGFSRAVHRGLPSWVSASASSPGSPGGLGSSAHPGRVPRPRRRPANCPGPG